VRNVAAYWSVAIFGKMLYLNVRPLDVVPVMSGDIVIGDVIAYFTLVLLTDIVSFVLTIDSAFI
jgi:hypothetical protein